MKTTRLTILTMAIMSFTIASCGQSKATVKPEQKEILDFIEKQMLNGQKPFSSEIENGVKTIRFTENIGDPTIMVPADTKGFLRGDLTGDGQTDIIASATMTVGVSTAINIYYFFKGANGKFTYVADFSARDLDNCKTESDYNYFSIEKISDNYLIGKSSCWTQMDPHCCPSSVTATKLKWDSNSKKFKATN